MPNPFISTQDLTDLLGRNVNSDNGAVMAVDAACDICRDIAEQDFNLATTTETLDGTGTDCLILPQRPVVAAGTVTVHGSAVTDYMVASGGRLIRGTATSCWAPTWPRGRQNVKVTYDHGFADGSVPRSVRMVALGLAMRLVVQGAATAETVGDVTATYGGPASELTQNELRILTKYRATRSF